MERHAAVDPMTTHWFDRAEALRRLADDPFDVLVVGGGITGAGTALDAASRGLRTALVERDDFASGTSSKSSKLVHGGLRYLQQGEIRLVYQALHERQRLTRNAPHLVKLLPFLIPMFTGKDGVLNPEAGAAPSARPCGCTTSPAAPASASCTSGSPGPRRSSTCPRSAGGPSGLGLPVLRRTRPTTPASP